jgi:hypothetical protein
MANTIVTPQIIAKEALMQLENSMVMGNLVHRDYKKEFVKVGSTVSVRKPVRFVASDGSTRVNQDATEATTSIIINKQKHVSWNFSSQELTLSIEEYSERYIKPAMIALGNQVDADLCGLYIDIFNAVGAANTTPSTYATIAAAARRLDEEACPDDGERVCVLDPAAAWTLASSATGSMFNVFNPGIVSDVLRKGKLGDMANMQMFKSQNIKAHTPGSDLSGTVNGVGQVGSTLVASSTSYKKGDIFTLATSNAVNPISRQSTGSLRQFVATADGTTSLSIYPSIITSGAYQTVSVVPTDSGAITGIGTASTDYVNSLAFHKNAFALVMCPMELPDGAPFKARESYNNMSVRVIKDYDINSDTEIIRLDILYGVKTLFPELACRILG